MLNNVRPVSNLNQFHAISTKEESIKYAIFDVQIRAYLFNLSKNKYIIELNHTNCYNNNADFSIALKIIISLALVTLFVSNDLLAQNLYED